jgi:hypothetical protein
VLAVPSFPALANDGTTLSLISKEGKVIHFVSYSISWYQNVIKQDGGWSLEMIDAHNSCSGESNWKASTDNSGGTPGRKNSVDGINKDSKAPLVNNIYAKDNSTIILQFDEPVDSIVAANISHYSLSPLININSITVSTIGFADLQLNLNTPLSPGIVYTLSVSAIKDCAGNTSNTTEHTLGLPQDALSSDVVINEICLIQNRTATIMWKFITGVRK